MQNAQKKVNYTDEQVTLLRSMYAELGNDGLDQIAEKLEKSVRSIRAKLVRDGLYVAPVSSVKSVREEGPSKKEIMQSIIEKGFDVEGFEGATKAALQRLLVLITA